MKYKFNESHTLLLSIDLGIPCSWCQLESIQNFLKPAHMGLLPTYLKALRLLYVHFFLGDPINESCLHIHLMHTPSHK